MLETNEILETYTMTPEEEIKWLRQCVRELQEEREQLKEDYNKVVHEATEFESKVYELEEVINKAIHRIQLLQMDGEVTIRDLGLIVRDLKGENNGNIS